MCLDAEKGKRESTEPKELKRKIERKRCKLHLLNQAKPCQQHLTVDFHHFHSLDAVVLTDDVLNLRVGRRKKDNDSGPLHHHLASTEEEILISIAR